MVLPFEDWVAEGLLALSGSHNSQQEAIFNVDRCAISHRAVDEGGTILLATWHTTRFDFVVLHWKVDFELSKALFDKMLLVGHWAFALNRCKYQCNLTVGEVLVLVGIVQSGKLSHLGHKIFVTSCEIVGTCSGIGWGYGQPQSPGERQETPRNKTSSPP